MRIVIKMKKESGLGGYEGREIGNRNIHNNNNNNNDNKKIPL